MPEINWNADLYNTQHHFVYKYGENVLEWLNPVAREKILDVGCGTGQLSEKIRTTGAIVTGIDASPAMIKKARDKYPAIEFFVKDAGRFSFEEPFDAIFSNATLHWINEQEDALRCIHHALCDHGRFVFEMGGKDNIASIDGAIRQAMTNEQVANKLPATTYYFPSVAEQAALLEKNGFTVAEVLYFNRPTKLEGEEGMRCWIEQFFGFIFQQIDDRTRLAVIERALAQLRLTNYHDGEWIADYVRLRMKAIKK